MTDHEIAEHLRTMVRQGAITGWYQWTLSIRSGPRWTLAHPDRTTTTMDRDTITAHLSDAPTAAEPPDLEDVPYGTSSYSPAEAETVRRAVARRRPLPGKPLRLSDLMPKFSGHTKRHKNISKPRHPP